MSEADRSGVKCAVRLLEVAAVIVFVYLFARAMLLPTPAYRERPKDAEVKSHLHDIQLAVERYAVDHGDAYPAYLIGGEARWSAVVDTTNRKHPFSNEIACAELKQVADPLLREGYLTAYPRNPYAKNGVAVHNAQLTLPLNAPGGDPLRNGVDTGRLYGTRFGAYCTCVGQLLGAKYYCALASMQPGGQLGVTGVTTAPIPGLPPGADVTYPCWDAWTSSKVCNPLPGQFIYAGAGVMTSPSTGALVQNATQLLLPTESDGYLLAGFGGPRTQGEDVIDSAGIPLGVSLLGDYSGPGLFLGYGNPNGIADGIVLTLTPGWGTF
jgi:hypothetical protein